MKKLHFIIVVFLLLLIPYFSFATDYYVDSDGTSCSSPSDTDYDPATATCGAGSSKVWTTITGCVGGQSLTAGDNVYLRAGTYTETVTITSSDDGNGGSYVTFKTYADEDVIIRVTSSQSQVLLIYDSGTRVQYVKFDGRGTDSGYHLTIDANDNAENACQVRYASYIDFTGVNFTGSSANNGIKLYSKTQGGAGDESTDDGTKSCTLSYCKFYSNADYGVKLTGYGTDDNTFSHCDIYENGTVGDDKYGVNLSGSEYEANQPNGNIFDSCNIYSNYKTGIAVLYADNTRISNCNVYSNGTGDGAGRGIALSTNSNSSLVYGNTVYSNAYYGIEIISSSNKIYNNIVYNNGSYNIHQQTSGTGNQILNNSIYDSQASTRYGIYIKTDSSAIVKNNISWVVNGWPFRCDTDLSEVDTNDFYRLSTTDVAYFDGTGNTVTELNAESWADGNVYADPAWDGSYDLTSSTPASLIGSAEVLSGTFTTDRHGDTRGTAWDMGADEYAFDSTPSATGGQGFTLTGGTLQ